MAPRAEWRAVGRARAAARDRPGGGRPRRPVVDRRLRARGGHSRDHPRAAPQGDEGRRRPAPRLRRLARMTRRLGRPLGRLVSIVLTAILLLPSIPGAQDKPAAKPFKPEELEQIVAPIALYP